LFGQDFTPFGSSTLPAIYETTGLGLGYGTLYERAPQFRFGLGHKIGGSRNVFFQPEFALVMPAYGNDPKAIDNQLGYGERQGADSAKPEIHGRIVTQWQLDKAPGVVPAQLIFSGVHGDRTALVRAADVPLCPAATTGCPTNEKVFQDAFATGAQVSSQRWGYTAELNWKLNNLVTFTWEQSYYRTRVVGDPTGKLPFPTYRGVPSRQWQDIRTEIGPTFTF